MALQIRTLPHVSWTRIGDVVYIVDERNSNIITLEDSGISLWELIVTGQSFDCIVNVLARPDHLEEDRSEIIQFILTVLPSCVGWLGIMFLNEFNAEADTVDEAGLLVQSTEAADSIDDLVFSLRFLPVMV